MGLGGQGEEGLWYTAPSPLPQAFESMLPIPTGTIDINVMRCKRAMEIGANKQLGNNEPWCRGKRVCVSVLPSFLTFRIQLPNSSCASQSCSATSKLSRAFSTLVLYTSRASASVVAMMEGKPCNLGRTAERGKDCRYKIQGANTQLQPYPCRVRRRKKGKGGGRRRQKSTCKREKRSGQSGARRENVVGFGLVS